MSFELQIFGGDKGHHAKAHHDAGHKLHEEAHKLFDKFHHGFEKAKPVLHQVGHEAEKVGKSYAGSAQRELHGNATPTDKHRLETVGKVAATVLLPHVVIGGAILKTGLEVAKHSNVHLSTEHHTQVKHGDSKQ